MSNLNDFGSRELAIAGELFSTINTTNDKTEIFDSCNVKSVKFNINSGRVFLVDNAYNIAVMKRNMLEDFIDEDE